MISIIIPTYNESKNIQELVERIKKCLLIPYEIIIVDDGSPDGTGLLAEKLAIEHPIKVIHRPNKLGLASAVIEGFRVATGDLIGVMDSDLSHPPEIIPNLLFELENQNADIAVGSRFAPGGAIENWPKKRLISTNIAMMTVRLLTSIKDPMSGFFILKKDVIHNVPLIPRGFKILLEILVKGRYQRAIEYPIIFKDRVYGASKLSSKVYWEFAAQLLDLYSYKFKSILKSSS